MISTFTFGSIFVVFERFITCVKYVDTRAAVRKVEGGGDVGGGVKEEVVSHVHGCHLRSVTFSCFCFM